MNIPPQFIATARSFNRHWSQVLGLLDRGLLRTAHSLPEARVIFELARQKELERSELRERLDIDASFLTRVLARLEGKGLMAATQSAEDGRRVILKLTSAGRRAFADLDRRSSGQVEALLEPLKPLQRRSAVEAMTVLRYVIGSGRREEPQISIRGLESGDLGWVVQRHGEVYADEFDWNMDFEALVAKIVAEYHMNHKPGRESAWIAEVDGARAGCIFCCQRDPKTAQLRILLVEQWARGLGIGSRLVDQCVDFATAAGYEAVSLWTNSVLTSARRIYEAAGFRLVSEKAHESFGHRLTGQDWALELKNTAKAPI